MKTTQSEVSTILNNTYQYLATHHVFTFEWTIQHYVFMWIWFNQIVGGGV